MSERTSYKPGEFCWVDLMAQTVGGAKEFYGNLFGWGSVDQETQGGPPYAIFQHGGKSVAGLGQLSPEMQRQRLPAIWNSYINVDDVTATCDRVVKLGGKVTMPAMQVIEVRTSRMYTREFGNGTSVE